LWLILEGSFGANKPKRYEQFDGANYDFWLVCVVVKILRPRFAIFAKNSLGLRVGRFMFPI